MFYTSRPAKIKKSDLNHILKQFRPNTHTSKIVEFVAKKSQVEGSVLREASGTSHIAQLVRSAINPVLFREGYAIACHKKPGSSDFTWAVYRLSDRGDRHAC